MGVSLWALVAWIALRERNLALRLTVSALFAAALFFCHLFALGTYGLGMLAFELHRLLISPSLPALPGKRGRELPARLFDFLATRLPFLPVLPLLMMGPTLRAGRQITCDRAGRTP